MASKKLEALFRRKSFQAAFCVACLLMIAWSIYGFIGLVHQAHTRSIAKDFAAANAELQTSPPGLERTETFLKRVKAIDTSYAPAAVKHALQDYISAFDQSLAALKAGHDTTQFDPAIADAKRRLIDAVWQNE